MDSSIAVERVKSEIQKAEEEARNEETIIADEDYNFENGKKPVIPAADHHEEVDPIISPTETVESDQATKNMKNDKMKQKKEVQVSNTKKPFIFYLNRAKRYINEFYEVELCGLGMAIPTVVTIADILTRNGFAIQKGITTSTVLSIHGDRTGRRIEKAKIEIVLGKAEEN